MTAVLLSGNKCMKNISMILACIFLVCSSAYASSPEVKNVQYLLNQIGFNAGKEDGLYGNTTKKALVDFYASQGKIFDGSADQNEISDLILENSKFMPTKNKIKFANFYYTTKIQSCQAMGVRSFKDSYNIKKVEGLIGYDWPTDHDQNSNSRDVIHKNITQPIKFLLQATHNAISENDVASIDIATKLLVRIAEADTLYDSIGYIAVKQKPRCYANGDYRSKCWYHEYEFARGVFSNFMIAAIWLRAQLTPHEFELVDRYINKMYDKFIRPTEFKEQEQGLYQMANGGLSILIYASWMNDKDLAAEEIKFRFKELNRIIFLDGYIDNNSFRGVRSQWYHSYGLDIALGYVYIADLWGAETPETLHYKLVNSGKIANLAITDWQKFKSRKFTGPNRNALKGKEHAIKHTHQMAISIDKLMLIVTGVKLENDPIYLRKREYHAKDGIDDLIGFNANCI
jgi:hypothetical protein